MNLNRKQISHLRSLAHSLSPVVIIGGGGLSEAVVNEIDGQLAHHELIKVRVNAKDREQRQAMIEAICQQTKAALVQSIGHVGIFYRQAKKPVIVLPKI